MRVLLSALMLFVLLMDSASVTTQNLPVAKKPLEYQLAQANFTMVEIATTWFWLGEGRYPKNLEELLHSVYFVVKPEDFINPYTHKPVQQTTREAPSLGDIYYASLPGTNIELQIEVYGIHDEKASGPVKIAQVGRPGGWAEFMGLPKLKELVKTYLNTLEPEERKMYWICRTIESLMGTAGGSLGPGTPTTWEELKKLHYIGNFNIKNPFTGEPIQAVGFQSPSPGNFTYAGMKGTNNTLGMPLPICYGRKGQIIYPEPEQFQKFLEGQKQTAKAIGKELFILPQ